MNDSEWHNEWQRMTMSGTTNDNDWYEWQWMRKSDNKWERLTTNDNEWQRVTAHGKTNKNSTVHFNEWMIAIPSMTKTDTLFKGWMATIRVIK